MKKPNTKSLLEIRQDERNITLIEIFNCGFIAFLLCLCFKTQVFFDPDTAWHIKAGQFILQNKMIPYTDPWSFTSDQEWYLLSWLWDIFAYLIYLGFGFKGILVAQALTCGVLIAYVAYSLNDLKGIRRTAILTTVGIVGLCLWPLLHFRPQLHVYLLFLFFINTLRSQHLRYLKVGLVYLLWGNIHGSFILGLCVLGYYGLFAIYERNYKELRSLIIISLIAVLATLINPYGLWIYYGVMRTLDSVITDMIMEWHPFTFGNSFAFSTVVLSVIALNRYDFVVPLKERLLSYILLAMSLVSIRNFAFFGLGSLTFIANMFNKHLVETKNYNPFFPKFITKFSPILFAIALVSVLMRFSYLDNEKMFENMPQDSIDYISQNCRPGELFNDYNIGGFVIFSLSDKGFHNLIDGRAGTVYSEEFLKEYISFVWDNNKLESFSLMNDPQIAIISNYLLSKANIAKYFEKWDNAYTGPIASVYVKPGSSACKIHR